MEHIWSVAGMAWGSILFWNLIFAVILVFFERRTPEKVWAWLLLLFLLPGVGFFLYLMCGRRLWGDGLGSREQEEEGREQESSVQEGKESKRQEREEQGKKEQRSGEQEEESKEQGRKGRESREQREGAEAYRLLKSYNEGFGARLTKKNQVTIFTGGQEKFEALLEDLERAKKRIYMQYYIIREDVLFHRIEEILKKKVEQGVEVKILYDAMGCRGTGKGFWRRLEKAGIRTAAFFPAFLGRLQFRINYRNHRKIVVADGKTGYVGGFNIGREYVGLDDSFGHWRDTHLRICGEGAAELERQFWQDWKRATGEALRESLAETSEKQEAFGEEGALCSLQVVNSGPLEEAEQIRDNYLWLITHAKRSIFIQTPYFIPDEPVLNALLFAVRCGVEVNLMIPCEPDHPFVYQATRSYAGQLVEAGANCYVYENGFLHSKGILCDGEIFCYGTANLDIRSFALNFEVNVTVYDREKAQEMEKIFRVDMEKCSQISREGLTERPFLVKCREQICRLLSPLL